MRGGEIPAVRIAPSRLRTMELLGNGELRPRRTTVARKLLPLLFAVTAAGLAWNSCDAKDMQCVLFALRCFLIPLLLWKTAGLTLKVFRGQLSPLRLALPLLILIEVALVGAHFISRQAGMVSLGLVDVAVLGLAIWTCFQIRSSFKSEHPERILERSLLRFFPQPFSRVAAIELTIVASSLGAFRHLWNNQKYDATTYVENAKIRLLVFALPVMLVPDLIFVHLVIPGHLLVLKIVLDALGVYGCLWILGIFATMSTRRHEIRPSSVKLHRGILNTIEFDPRSLQSATRMPMQRRFRCVDKTMPEAHLTVRGVECVEILLKEPARAENLFGFGRKQVLRVLVASDQPDELCKRLFDSKVAADNL